MFTLNSENSNKRHTLVIVMALTTLTTQSLFLFVIGHSHNPQMTSMENSTQVIEIIPVRITDDPELQMLLFVMFTLIHLIALLGNLGSYRSCWTLVFTLPWTSSSVILLWWTLVTPQRSLPK